MTRGLARCCRTMRVVRRAALRCGYVIRCDGTLFHTNARVYEAWYV